MSFTGSCFLAGATQGIPVALRANASATVAQAADGTTWELPHRDTTLRRGGHDGAMLFLTGRQDGGPTLCSADPAFTTELRLCAGRVLNPEFVRLGAHGRRRLGCLGLVLAGLLVLMLGTGAALWWVATNGVRQAVAALPPSIDRQLGDAGFSQMDLGGERTTDPLLTGAVEAIAARLRSQAERHDFDFRFTVVRADTINAFALPGGQMVVYTGLIAQCDDPAQLAGVMAHEMAHVTRRHGLHGVARQAGLLIGVQLLLGDVSGLAGLATQGGMTAIINGYSRDMEHEADTEGARMLAAAGFDPLAMATFFGRLAAAGDKSPGWLAWMSTHPDHAERIAAITALAPKLPRGMAVALDLDWQAVRAAAGATTAGIEAP